MKHGRTLAVRCGEYNDKGLHHNAYRCKDSEETRQFYQDFSGLKFKNAFEIETTQTGRETSASLVLRNGGWLLTRFFEAPDQPFEFKNSMILIFI